MSINTLVAIKAWLTSTCNDINNSDSTIKSYAPTGNRILKQYGSETVNAKPDN